MSFNTQPNSTISTSTTSTTTSQTLETELLQLWNATRTGTPDQQKEAEKTIQNRGLEIAKSIIDRITFSPELRRLFGPNYDEPVKLLPNLNATSIKEKHIRVYSDLPKSIYCVGAALADVFSCGCQCDKAEKRDRASGVVVIMPIILEKHVLPLIELYLIQGEDRLRGKFHRAAIRYILQNNNINLKHEKKESNAKILPEITQTDNAKSYEQEMKIVVDRYMEQYVGSLTPAIIALNEIIEPRLQKLMGIEIKISYGSWSAIGEKPHIQIKEITPNGIMLSSKVDAALFAEARNFVCGIYAVSNDLNNISNIDFYAETRTKFSGLTVIPNPSPIFDLLANHSAIPHNMDRLKRGFNYELIKAFNGTEAEARNNYISSDLTYNWLKTRLSAIKAQATTSTSTSTSSSSSSSSSSTAATAITTTATSGAATNVSKLTMFATSVNQPASLATPTTTAVTPTTTATATATASSTTAIDTQTTTSATTATVQHKY